MVFQRCIARVVFVVVGTDKHVSSVANGRIGQFWVRWTSTPIQVERSKFSVDSNNVAIRSKQATHGLPTTVSYRLPPPLSPLQLNYRTRHKLLRLLCVVAQLESGTIAFELWESKSNLNTAHISNNILDRSSPTHQSYTDSMHYSFHLVTLTDWCMACRNIETT